VVLDDHLRDETSEWREFGTVEDVARGNVPGRKARCGDVVVDESRWVGGLMPTTVGREPYSGAGAGGGAGGNAEERQKLASLRQRLKRTHNMIENMLEKEQKERYRDVVLEEKARVAKVARGEEVNDGNDDITTTAINFAETCVTVKGDYEGLLMMQKMEQSQISSSTTTTTTLSKNPKTNETYTALNNKWSLTHAILLYGTIQHVQQYAGDYHQGGGNNTDGGGGEWTHSTLEMERRTLSKKLDATTRSSTHKLYVAFALLEKAARKLEFHGIANGTFREAISWLVKFASVRDDLKIGGISSGKKGGRHSLDISCNNEKLFLSLFSSGGDELENLLSSTLMMKKSTSKKSSIVWNELHRMKQYASLGAAILYVSAKRTGVGRTLAEVCSAFGTFAVVTDGSSEKRVDMESLVRPKYCSKAMEELKQAVPDVLAPVQNAVASAAPQPPSVPSSCASVASAKQELSSQPLESIARVTPDYLPSDMSNTIINNTNAEESALADLTSRMASSLNLPPSAAVAAIAAATQCKRDKSASPEARKPTKYIRPRQRKSKSALKNDSDEIIAAASLLLVTTAGGIMQRLAEQALNNTQTISDAQLDMFASWSEWNSQPPWHREVSHLEECTGLPSKNILMCYSNNIHPRRAHLLGAVKRKFEFGDDGDTYLQNIAVAVPLMSLKH